MGDPTAVMGNNANKLGVVAHRVWTNCTDNKNLFGMKTEESFDRTLAK